MQKYLELPGASDLFFEGKSSGERVNVNQVLKRFGKDYLPGSFPASPTLLRKQYASLVDEREGAAKELIAAFNAHLASTGDSGRFNEHGPPLLGCC